MCTVQRHLLCLVYLILFLFYTSLGMNEKVQWPWYNKSLLAKFNAKEMAKISTDF